LSNPGWYPPPNIKFINIKVAGLRERTQLVQLGGCYSESIFGYARILEPLVSVLGVFSLTDYTGSVTTTPLESGSRTPSGLPPTFASALAMDRLEIHFKWSGITSARLGCGAASGRSTSGLGRDNTTSGRLMHRLVKERAKQSKLCFRSASGRMQISGGSHALMASGNFTKPQISTNGLSHRMNFTRRADFHYKFVASLVDWGFLLNGTACC
jgi:hypothetical protein